MSVGGKTLKRICVLGGKTVAALYATGGRNVVVSRLNRQRGCMFMCVYVQYNKMAFSIERLRAPEGRAVAVAAAVTLMGWRVG